MTGPHLPDGSLLNTVHDLALACLSGKATQGQVASLEQLVCSDPEARRIYANIIRDSIHLHRWAAAVRLQHDELSPRQASAADASASLLSAVDALVAEMVGRPLVGSIPRPRLPENPSPPATTSTRSNHLAADLGMLRINCGTVVIGANTTRRLWTSRTTLVDWLT